MNFKKGYIEVCLTTEDSIQHLRCHGWLKREKYLIKSEHIFNKAEKKDFGMFIIVITNDDLYGIKDLDILIEFFEKKERYEDCAFLLKIKDKVVSGIKAKEK
jgi:hypothetical protein